MIIIGITGTLGAGKGTVVEYLINHKGFEHYSVRAFLIEEIKKRNLPVDRNSMTLVANDLRAKYGAAYIVEQLFKQASASGKNCIIESIRNPGEIKSLKEKGKFYLLAVDADIKTRYERITNRKSETDNISYETFIANEKREMESTDPSKQNISACIKQADFIIYNNNSVEELQKETESIINGIE